MPEARSSEAVVRAYHQRSKHGLQAYAAGPETLDWEAQPRPWRCYAGLDGPRRLLLPLLADDALPASWAQIHGQGLPPQPLDRARVAALLLLSLGLSAWKQQGPDRWALRCNPSSGNLHPTEAYVIAQGLPDLPDGLWHHQPLGHALAQRARGLTSTETVRPRLWLGLSSIHWREAWKYGERAFRYCQLDAGHALGALRYAAAVLGWRARRVDGLSHAQVAGWLGTDREADFGPAEREEAELLVELGPEPHGQAPQLNLVDWAGQANRLDARPMYRWPVIDEVASATRLRPAPPSVSPAKAGSAAPPAPPVAPDAPPPWEPVLGGEAMAAGLIRQRRSAQRFDRRAVMSLPALAQLVQALQPSAGLPWDVLAQVDGPQLHPVLFVHRVDGLAPGAYALPRSGAGEALMRQALGAAGAEAVPLSLDWHPVRLPAPSGAQPRLWRLAENPALAGTLRTLACHQALGADAMLGVALLASFDQGLRTAGDGYRLLLQEAGLLGQVLYLQAEALGLRGTGIGCFFDDALHGLLGQVLADTRLQCLYQFTVGLPLADARIATTPAHEHLAGRSLLSREDLA